MPIGIGEPLVNYLVQRYLDFLTPEIEAQIFPNKNIFDIEIVTPIEGIEFFLFDEDQRQPKKYIERRVHEMCYQFKFGSLSFR